MMMSTVEFLYLWLCELVTEAAAETELSIKHKHKEGERGRKREAQIGEEIR